MREERKEEEEGDFGVAGVEEGAFEVVEEVAGDFEVVGEVKRRSGRVKRNSEVLREESKSDSGRKRRVCGEDFDYFAFSGEDVKEEG